MSKSPESSAKHPPPSTSSSQLTSPTADAQPRAIASSSSARRTSSNRYPLNSYVSPPAQHRAVSSPDDFQNAVQQRHREPTPLTNPYGVFGRARTPHQAGSSARDRSSYNNRSPSLSRLGTEAGEYQRNRPALNLSLHHSSSGGQSYATSSASTHSSTPYQDFSSTQTPSELSNTPQIFSSDNEEDDTLAGNIIYERQLLQKKHGFPLWIPHPNMRLPKSYTDKGVSVGDVGIVTPYGSFDYLFNVCLHAEHPNNAGPLPEGFVPLLIQQKDISETPEHGPGSYLCSSSVTSTQDHASSLSFHSVEGEGAVLTMPEGAIHEDVRNLSKFREYAAVHAQNWYKFTNGVCGREIENGELHLVTGCDKTTSWGMATFARLAGGDASAATQPPLAPVSLDFMFHLTSDSEAGDGCVCSWTQSGNAEVKSTSNSADADGVRHRNQCTFFRSHTVTLSEDEWAKVQATVEVANGGYVSDATSDTASRSSRTPKNALKRLFSSFSQKSGSSTSSRSQAPVVTKSFTETPRRLPHPSATINKLLLQKNPRARVAVTHDDEWALLIPDPSNPPSTPDLWSDIQLKFDIVLDASGSVYLALKEAFSLKLKLDQNSILTDVDLPPGASSILSPPPATPRAALGATPEYPDELVDRSKHTPESLIDSIAVSKTPNPAEVRLLVKMLSTQAPPPFPTLQRALFPLFVDKEDSTGVIPVLHTLGFDVMAAYWENPFVKDSDEPRMSSDRLSCFTFFLEPTLVSWSLENWETQFKAFQSVTKHGQQIKGVEVTVIDMLKRWLLITFQRLVQLSTANEPEATAECERCILVVGRYLADLLKQENNVARIYDEVLIDVLRFHSLLIDQLILIPGPQTAQNLSLESPASPTIEKSLRRAHKKTGSSLSISSLMFATAPSPSPTPKPAPPSPSVKHPAELAISLFLEHLSGHLLNLKASQLMNVLPPLFRALAFCASPLPRLTLQGSANKPASLEDRIVDLLNTLVPTSSFPTCMRALKQHLFPAETGESGNTTPTKSTAAADAAVNEASAGTNSEATEFPFPMPATATTPHSMPGTATSNNRFFDSLYLMIMTGLGASRTLRNFVRRALAARLESVYSTKESEGAKQPREKPVGAINRFAIDQDLLDVVWLRHSHSVSSHLDKSVRTLASSIDAWVAWDTDLPEAELHSSQYNLYEKVRDGREHILEEGAGILKDIYQEFELSEEAMVKRDESELEPINDALKCLCMYLVSLQSPDGTPFVINAFHPGDAPTPLLRSITTLLSRDFSRNADPVLAEILFLVCDHVTDDNTARIPDLMLDHHQLFPITPQWIENWGRLLSNQTLLSSSRPLTRKAVIDALHSAYFFIKDIPAHRRMLADVVIEYTPSIVGPQFCDPLWEILEDDAVIAVSDIFDHPEDEEKDLPPSIRLLVKLVFSQPDAAARPVLRTLINIFSQISFTPLSSSQTVQKVSLHLFVTFVRMLQDLISVPCRLLLLQFLMRLRADRNHRVYLAVEGCGTHGLISYLASLIDRVPDSLMQAHRDEILEEHVARKRAARPRGIQSKTSHASSSTSAARARSRTLLADPVSPPHQSEHVPLWQLPEALDFRVDEADVVKTCMISYDPEGPNRVVVLPISRYLHTLATLIESDPSWELVSYILCYLPTQLSNKHLFCGPRNRASISKMLLILTTGIIRGHLASQTAETCPEDLRLRDLQGLAQHTLSTMISYKPNLDIQQRQLLLEAFQSGLDGPFSTIKCSLHALTLSAYELPNNLSKALPQILEKLVQIMSNPNMAVHILAFINIVGTLPSLYASFTEDDFKMVFGVALQYLQHYNQLRESPTRSWALSQHVRQQSYCAVYTWFLVLKIPDRQHHIPFITRQLLLANDGKEELDGLTKVCFDWLARNSYGMTDSKAMVNDIVLLPNIAKPENHPYKKTWMMGNMFISIRPTHRPGWLEFMSRRPSGSALLICRKDDFVNVAKDNEVKECESFVEVLQVASDELEVATTPVGEMLPQEIVLHPTSQEENDQALITFASRLLFHLSPISTTPPEIKDVTEVPALPKSVNLLDKIPVIDTHKVGIMYVGPGQTNEVDILRNAYGSQAYSRFLDGLGRLIHIRTEKDVYTGSLDPNEDGEYAYAWWDEIRQILFHTATLMPIHDNDPNLNYKKRHIGNDYVRIVWNDSGLPYRFDTLSTAFQFVNIIIEPHSVGTISAFSNDAHENEFFRVIVQTASGMTECTPVGQFKIVSAVNLPHYVRQLAVLTDCFTGIFSSTSYDTQRVEIITNWNARLDSMGRFKKQANDYFHTLEQRMNSNNTDNNTSNATSP
ncbi:hypothetical protein DFP72DRAFT_909439 [Ephemerocybe angulata]|uniref:Rap-GAP domain-containing protein n=1 Tax=Ephemerocybe angulata TaxID=980116 RepID=A0A8H6M456_9AGAR|nr:hypothetical protein DFP72DRAFT_909439 [Tulosesus angulatus]